MVAPSSNQLEPSLKLLLPQFKLYMIHLSLSFLQASSFILPSSIFPSFTLYLGNPWESFTSRLLSPSRTMKLHAVLLAFFGTLTTGVSAQIQAPLRTTDCNPGLDVPGNNPLCVSVSCLLFITLSHQLTTSHSSNTIPRTMFYNSINSIWIRTHQSRKSSPTTHLSLADTCTAGKNSIS